jgi:hypothetical protein
MVQDPFPDPGNDGEEPESSPLPPPAEEDGPVQQGLYICLPPEQLTLAGFAQGGEADTMAPGPLLGTVVHTVAGQDGKGLAGCSDDQLMGIISAAQRLASHNAWVQMAAMAEFAARRSGSRPEDEFAADELALELHLNPLSAREQMDYATAVSARLPATFAALGAGRIHPVHVRIVEDETRFLSDADAATADAILAQTAPGQTFSELRHAAHKLILKLDPDAARKRKEAARGQAHVRPFRERSGNAGMVARELPSDEVLASSLAARRAARPGPARRRPARQPARTPHPRLPGPAARTRQPPPAHRRCPCPCPCPRPTQPRPRLWRSRRERRPGRSRSPSRSRSRSRLRRRHRPQPGRAGHHHHPLGHLARPIRHPRPGHRIRRPGR